MTHGEKALFRRGLLVSASGAVEPREFDSPVSTGQSELLEWTQKERVLMGLTFRARVKGGLLEPLEKMDLPEGKEVLITVLKVPAGRDDEASRRSFGSWKGTIDAEELIRNIYADRLISTRPVPKL